MSCENLLLEYGAVDEVFHHLGYVARVMALHRMEATAFRGHSTIGSDGGSDPIAFGSDCRFDISTLPPDSCV